MTPRERVRIEVLAAGYSADIIANDRPTMPVGGAAFDGWWTHRNGQSPVVGRWSGGAGIKYMAGWLARQIVRHHQGDEP